MNRISNTPLDAETTSAYGYDINGYRYIMAVTQHPMADQATDVANKQSQAGYIGPIDMY